MSFPRKIYREEAQARGYSDDYIDAILDYADKLESKNLPVIYSLAHFSLLTGLDYYTTRYIIKFRSSFYKEYYITKKRGGFRKISSPYRPLKIMQQYIAKYILSNVPIHEKAFGFVPTKSIYHNAKEHVNQDCILNIDLCNFFETISSKKIYSIFMNMGYASNLCVDFSKICTAAIESKSLLPVLPQGAPTSPVLSNICAYNLDKRLDRFAHKNNLVYSRYADDITFSGLRKDLPKVSFLKRVIEDEGFKLNTSKIRLYTKKNNKRIITGLLVDDSVRIPKKFKKEIFRHLHFCQKYSPKEHIDYLNSKRSKPKGYFYEWLKGKISFVQMVEPKIGEKMFKEFDRIDWGIK